MGEIKRPNDVESERELLTACFKSENPNYSKEDVIKQVVTELEPSYFAHPHMELICMALMESVHDAGMGEVTWLDVRGNIPDGSQARATLKDMVSGKTEYKPVSKYRCDTMVKKLTEAHRARQILSLTESVITRAKAGAAEDAFNTLMDGVFSMSRDKNSSGAQPIFNYIDGIKEEVTYRRTTNGIVGLETGLAPLDNVFGGMQKKHLYYLGGRPGHRKSVVIGQVASFVAEKEKRALICSPEMAAEQYIMRLACKICNMDYDLYNLGNYSEKQEKAVHDALEALRNRNIIINEAGMQDTNSIRKDLMRFKPDILLVDYAQLFNPSRPSYNEYKDLSLFSRELNAMKKDFNIPILAAVQLSRKVEEREIKRPIPSDIRATGQFEQDADGIFMLYSAREYATQDELGIWRLGDDEIDPTELEFVCAKNRHGKRVDVMTYVHEGEMWISNDRK